MLGDSWVEDFAVCFIIFGALFCVLAVLFDRVLQWEEQKARKEQ
jgi:hypothetical protein